MGVTYAKFKSGNYDAGNYTSTANTSAGDVVVVGDTVRIAHRDIAANVLGSLALQGGVYELPKTAGASTAIADGKKVYWDATNHVIVSTSSSGTMIGKTVVASVDADTTQDVNHLPA